MYCKYPNSEIILWCDGRVAVEEFGNSKRKRDNSSSTSSKRQKREDEIDSVFEKLKEMQIRYSKIAIVGPHDCWTCTQGFENPPDLPAVGSTPQKRKESVASAIGGAAVAITKALIEWDS
jgi:hypothetical protein